jgi:hypothetical protein
MELMMNLSAQERILGVTALLAMVIGLSCFAQSPVDSLSSGMVVDPSGKPIPKAVVCIEYQGNRKSFTTNNNGIFRFEKSVFAQGELSVEAKGFSKLNARLCEEWNWSQNKSFDYKFTLYPDFSLPESLSGTGALEGKVLVIAGDAFPGIVVQAEGTPIGTICDSNGIYKILNIPAGKYEFSCKIVGYSKTSLKSIAILPNSITHIDFIIFCCPSINRNPVRYK